MADEQQPWTTVGSAGTLNSGDLAKVTLHQSIVQLGVDIVPPSSPEPDVDGDADIEPGIIPTVSAVVRYNVTPVDGLFTTDPFRYGLQLRYRGRVRARLVELDLATGAERDLVTFASSAFPPLNALQVQNAFPDNDSRPMDFVRHAYYVEATLTAPAILAGHPAQISVIKVLASHPFH